MVVAAGVALQPLVQPVETIEVPHELQPVETVLQPLVQVLQGAGAGAAQLLQGAGVAQQRA